MGIYSNGSIFGIQIYIFNDDDIIILFEEKYDKEMSCNEMKQAYLFYTNINDKNNICFKVYTECISTLNYNSDKFMMWYPLSLDTFLEKFGI